MLWTTDYLNQITLEAEITIAREIPCIVDRYSLPITPGVAIYQLPDYIDNIRKVFYKGERLDPVSVSEYDKYVYTQEENTFGPFSDPAFSESFDSDSIITSTPSGKPFRYFYNGHGENTIVLNPSPSEEIDIYDNLYTTNIANAVIIEYYRLPDGVNHVLPRFFRRRLIKSYVLFKAFAKEGDGQNLDASQYYFNRYTVGLVKAKSIMNNIFMAITPVREPRNTRYKNLPARPVLPANFGIPVDEEYD